MLTYNVRLDSKSIRRDELVWSEKYLAPDLSFVSGVTDQNYHIDKKSGIAFSVGHETNSGSLDMTCENVARNGYVTIKGKIYDVKSGEATNYAEENAKHAYDYVEIGGVIYYITGSTITVKNWLKEEWTETDGEYTVKIVEGDVKAEVSGNEVYLDTIVWIEDEMVEIDGRKYYFDRYDVSSAGLSPGGLKYYEDGKCLEPSEITRTKDNVILYTHFDKESDYLYVTKFVLTKKEQKSVEFDKLSFCKYFYYVFYKNNYCPVIIDNGNYKCEVLNRLFTENIQEANYFDITQFQVYYEKDGAEVAVTTTEIDRMSLLKNIEAYIVIENTKLRVEHLMQNSNNGDELAVYLTDETTNISVGEIITLEDGSTDTYTTSFYTMGDEIFVLYNNKKYDLIDRLCDMVLINDHEYPIEYINGIVDDKDALVNILGEKVPMKIKNGGAVLERYGDTIVKGQDAAQVVQYEIVPYSGITINDTNYKVEAYDDGEVIVEIQEKIPYEFIVTNIEGSSLLTCVPNFSVYEFDDEFRRLVNERICDYFVTNQSSVTLYVRNRAFGKRDITDDIGYANGEDKPVSSNDYYNLFDNLILYTDTAHIHIPVKFDINVATNIMQDDIVERDFYRVEKEKAINDIVDMEKDVYIPKYIVSRNGEYAGSSTDFLPVSEIEVNLHFRTRNPESWKVYDGYNDIEVSGRTDNWFVTDYYPYYKLLETSGETLQRASDLMGLLYFTNDDVYYQRNKIAKSFLRFSYYDSTDPQTQSLLATSCVFMDEHRMFKTYIDNSRKNVHDYGVIEPRPEDEANLRKTVNNKISVDTEYLCLHKNKKRPLKTYKEDEVNEAVLKKDSRRISSRLIINNKYETDTSSEGFYIYIFKEYSEKLHPKPIYMKVEFNHAGVGRTIPFIIPMHWSGETSYYENNNVNIKSPEKRLRLSAATDVEEMKSGYTLSHVYAQTYIPLYAVYDFKKKEYAYIFDERYIPKPDDNDGKIILNMFELKIANEDADPTDAELKDITMGRSTKAVINVNRAQFPKIFFN